MKLSFLMLTAFVLMNAGGINAEESSDCCDNEEQEARPGYVRQRYYPERPSYENSKIRDPIDDERYQWTYPSQHDSSFYDELTR